MAAAPGIPPRASALDLLTTEPHVGWCRSAWLRLRELLVDAVTER